MSCHLAFLCRQNVHHTTPYVWITDDIFAEAFHRYARVSIRNSRLCKGRRHGSNVPGPLEARRRSAKRRMGMAAVNAANASPNPDFGALFSLGFGGNTSRSPPGSNWKWEAPRSQPQSPLDGMAGQKDVSWTMNRPKRQQQCKSWDSFLQLPDTSESVSWEGSVAESQKKMDALLESRDTKDIICREDLTDITDFLQGSVDEPGANNMLRLFEWLALKDISLDCIQELVNLTEQKFKLGTLNAEDTSTILSLLARSVKPEQLELLAACLNNFVEDSTFELICTTTTRLLIQHSAQQADSLKPDARILNWLQALRGCTRMQGFHYPNSTWQSVYSILAPIYRSPAQIARHLITLRKLDLSYILLRHWVPCIVARDWADSSEGSLSVTHLPSTRHWSPSLPMDLNHSHLEILLNEFQDLRQKRYNASGPRTRKFSSLIDLLSTLQDHQIPHVRLTQEICEILKLGRPTELFGIFRELRRHPTLGVNTELAAGLVRHFINREQSKLALYVYEAVPALTLRRCYELPLKLVHNGDVASARIFRVILRNTGRDIIPRDDRLPIDHSNTDLHPEHIDLVNLMAHGFAQSPHIPDRVAFRRVWECYRFLRSRRIPITSVLTRALVHAGVIRPLNEWTHISTNKFKWILHLVSEVEGQDVAERLDALVFQIWSQDIAPKLHAQGRSRNVRQLAVIKSNELEATRKRLKSWHLSDRWARIENR